MRLLEADLAARAKSQEIRVYIQGILAAAEARTVSDGERSLLETWLTWAAGYADRLDPALRGTAPRDPWSVGP